MSLSSLQAELLRLGYNPGPVDGIWGSLTQRAILAAYDAGALAFPAATAPLIGSYVIPLAWLPHADMRGIVLHWTGGAYTPNKIDLAHYHLLIDGDGNVIKGDHSIKDNESSTDLDYAAHAGGYNTKQIGVALCGMNGANQGNSDNGPYPITEKQWQVAIAVLAELANFYAISNTAIITHAEIWPRYKVGRSDKWDITRLPWNKSIKGADGVGSYLRDSVARARNLK